MLNLVLLASEEPNNPILPATNELIWGTLAFFVLVVLMSKLAYPAVLKAMNDRTEHIRTAVDDADRTKSEAQAVLVDYQRQVADAKGEAARIIEEARQTADSLKRDLTARAEAEAAELRQRNNEQIAAERQRVMAELQGQVATLAIELAEKVVGGSLDQQRSLQLIEDYINTVGTNGASAGEPSGGVGRLMDAAQIDSWAGALIEVARTDGALSAVEDELFRFARSLEGSDELRGALVDPAVPADRKRGILSDLLGAASPISAGIVSLIVTAGHARDLPAIVDRLVDRAATTRSAVVAQVRSAVPLDEGQQTRLATALGQAVGKDVEVRVVLDPGVLGGLIAQIGDTVIDGSVRTRLDQLKELL